MLNKTLRSTIIVLLQCFLPVALFLLFVPFLLHYSNVLNPLPAFFKIHGTAFLVGHGLFYISLFFLWPWGIKYFLGPHLQILDAKSMKTVLSARWYLLACMLFFELLVWWR